MHAVARNGPLVGLVLMLLAPLGNAAAVTAGVRVAVAGTVAGTVAAAPIVVGQPAPELSLPALASGDEPGQGAVTLADYRGKVVYLDFWSSWCAPCRRAMPHLDALRQEFSRKDFEVVGVNVDPVVDDARRFLEQVPVSYPIALDTDGDATRRLGVQALPALFVIDRAGVVRQAIRGGAVEARDDLRKTLARMIEEQEVQ